MPMIHATSLASAGGRIYAGTNAGDIHIYDARTREPITLLSSGTKAVVSSVAASPNGVAWVIGSRPTSIRDKYSSNDTPSDQTLIVRTPDDRQFTIDLKPAGVGSTVRSIAWMGPRVWMLTDFGAAFYNAKSNAVELGSTFLPRSIANEVDRSRVYVKEPFLLLARPVSMRRNPKSQGLPYVSLFTLYKQEGARWTTVGGFASNALDIEPKSALSIGDDGRIPADADFSIVSETVGFDETGIAAVEGDNLVNAPVFDPNWSTGRSPMLGWFSEDSHADPLWTEVVGDSIYTWNGTGLLRQSRTKPEATAFLPWNNPQVLPNAFLPDATGVWVATNVGVKRIEFGTPDPGVGYGEFISIPLGPETEKTPKALERVMRELFQWRFAPVDLAGKDGARMVSEVFKVAGLSLPASYQGILNASNGTPIHDEIRIGDVISSSRGLAVYLGNGKTVEVKKGAVGNGVIWDRPFAVVRRFVK